MAQLARWPRAVCLFLLAWTWSVGAAAEDSRSLATLVGPSVPLDERGLPAVLSQGDVALYQRIFALQEAGRMAAADGEIEDLRDRRLMGHVLAARYLHPTAYRTSFGELTAWLERFGDHPQAARLHRLALKRQPEGAVTPREPLVSRVAVGGAALAERSTYRSDTARTPAESRQIRSFERKVRGLIRKDELDDAETALKEDPDREALEPAELDQLRGSIARARYSDRDYKDAYKLASTAAKRSGTLVPATHWVAGLSAWRLKKWDAAAEHFSGVAESPQSSSWLAAGGAYWASRAHLRRRDPGSMSQWLNVAAGYPRSFYGLIAREALGLQLDFDFEGLELTRAEVQRLVADPSGGRALALLQVGQSEAARAELLQLSDWQRSALGEVLVALSNKAGMPGFAMTLARQLSDLQGESKSGRPLLAALYPIPAWEPDGGFAVDRALVFAVMRQESAFDPEAVSHAGARGLMQLMPRTASYIGEDPRLRGSRQAALFDPGLNLRLGQDYLTYLMGHRGIGDNLFRVIAAYNAGPGSVLRWAELAGPEDDALLFIESLPYGETRAYIEKVLANYWIYRKRLGQEPLSLSAVAEGSWPHYRQLDPARRQAAWIPEP
ncbi:MAG: lytic transglycosylase domain-containing protein [Pseudomonadota bacterium]